MRIVVLVKPVPDATGQERLGPDGRLDRTAAPPVMNGNDEYTLEAALQLAEAVGGDVTLLAMAPAEGVEALRKGLAMGAARAVVVTDDALAGSCARSTLEVLAAALRDIPFDLALAGADSADGGGGVVGAGIATLLGLPLVTGAAALDGRGGRRAPPCAAWRRRRGDGGGRPPRARGRHAAPRRAPLPDPEGDHGRPFEGGRRPLGRRPRPGGRLRRRGGWPRPSSSPSVRPRPAPATRVVHEAPAVAAGEIVDLLAERRAI